MDDAPPRRLRECCECHHEFCIEDLGTGVLTPRVVACPKCDARWREESYLQLSDDVTPSRQYRELVGPEVPLTTRSCPKNPQKA